MKILRVLALALVLGLAGFVSGCASTDPVPGRDYAQLDSAQPVPGGAQIVVVEFFWYGCPHCFRFEPLLDSWAKRLPPDVALRQVPVGFALPHQVHQKLFYALEEMGQLPALHRRVFTAIQEQNQRLNNEADIVTFVGANGVDRDKFAAAFKSFSVATKANRAKQLSEAYKIDGVPALGIHGRFYTSGSLAGSHERALAVTDFLIQRARQNA